MKSKKDIESTVGHLNENDTAIYVDCLLNNNLSNISHDILSHVELCSECKDKILDVFIYLRHSQSNARTDIEEPLFLKEKTTRQKSPFYVSRIAASFFLLALIIFVYFSFIKKDMQEQINDSKRSQIPPQTLIDKTKTPSKLDSSKYSIEKILDQKNGKKDVASEKKKDIQGPNFEINPNLEYMVNSQFRNVSLQIYSPKNNTYYKNEIKFFWEPTANKNLQIKILDNKNNVVLQYSVKKNKFFLKEKLFPGLYYWKLENQTDLLYVGKFYIENDSISQPK